MPRYSIIIHPPQYVIDEVNALKQKLYDVIGWYHSCRSLAHITVNLFSCNGQTISVWENVVAQYVQHTTAFEACFDRAMGFSNGAFVLLPGEDSYQKLRMLMKGFLQHIPAPAFGKSSKPHISIARKLSPEQALQAQALITQAEVRFLIDNFTIRKFNPEQGQYDIHKQFLFGNRM